MIITCNECSTRFNLDDFLVKEDGSKVRCAVCKHIFTVYPLAGKEPELEESSSFDLEESDFSIKDSDLEIEGAELETDDDKFIPETSDLDLDDDFSFDENELALDEEDGSQENDLAFGEDGLEFEAVSIDDETDFQGLDLQTSDETSGEASFIHEDEFELEFDVDEKTETEDTGPDVFDDETEDSPLEIETELDKTSPFLSEPEEEALPVITPEDDFSGYDEVLEQETEPDEDLLEQETIEAEDSFEEKKGFIEKAEPLMDTPSRSRRKKKKSSIGAPILVIVMIFLLVAGAYIASILTGYKVPYLSDIKIPFIEQYLKKTAPETSEAKPVPNQKSVNGRFVTNSSAGTLFVITGRVENPSAIPYSHIEIRGALITKGKTEAKTKNVFCGNIITEEILKTGNISDINKLLVVKTGNHNTNVKIMPGTSVPFMVVFSDLPEKLQNFTVKVINFEKAKSN